MRSWPTLPGTLERAIALLLLVLFSPALLVAAAAILLRDGPPVVFRQVRMGRAGEPFELVKLRTMRTDLPPPHVVGQVRNDNPLVLPLVGTFLRRTRLDEVPQLINVVRGEMAFVGPRPALTTDLAGYDQLQRRRLQVRPGLTGWAQVNGNTQLSWDDRIRLDLYYVDHRSWMLDLRVLLMTLWTVLAGERVHDRNVEEARRHANGLAGHGAVD